MPKDDGRKVMLLETRDGGVAILGYAGLGATARGTEPSDWMSSVLRGRNVSLEQSLSLITDAMKKEFRRHMLQVPGKYVPAHNIVIPAFLGDELKLYTIDFIFRPNTYEFHFTHWEMGAPPSAKGRPCRIGLIGLAGSGAACLLQNCPNGWKRHLLNLVKAHRRGLISSRAVAGYLAELNHEVHLREKSVGPRCVVVWRHRKASAQRDSGANEFYADGKRDPTGAVILPSIGTGMDLRAMFELMSPYVFGALAVICPL